MLLVNEGIFRVATIGDNDNHQILPICTLLLYLFAIYWGEHPKTVLWVGVSDGSLIALLMAQIPLRGSTHKSHLEQHIRISKG